ncbi:MAG: putative transporter [Succinivibrio sp.]|nr:putative transporter [Succinivibrio sp.]
MSQIAFLTLLIATAAVLGILLGMVKYRGIGLGIGGVLFSGILVGHIANAVFGFEVMDENGLTSAGEILHYMQEFGLILFVYAIGIAVGPSFFSSLKGMGLQLCTFAVAIIFLNCCIAMLLHMLGIVDLSAMIGMYAGGITNTPALGAGTSIISDVADALRAEGQDPKALGLVPAKVPSAYAMAYPFGLCSLLIVITLIRVVFKIDVKQAGEDYGKEKQEGNDDLLDEVVEVGEKFSGKTLADIPGLTKGLVICTRIRHGELLSVPESLGYVLMKGDVVRLVGQSKHVSKAEQAVGVASDDIVTRYSDTITVRHVTVTNHSAMGKTLWALDLESQYKVVISRVFRAGVQLMPSPDLKLAFGDELNVIGKLENVKKVGKILGNSSTTMTRVPMLPLFIGLLLGILLGSIPFSIPGIPTPLKLGVAGGPLIMAILLSRFGDQLTNNFIHWRLPISAQYAFQEIGITLFLSIVGITAGVNDFYETLSTGPGFKWMCWATLISFIPLLLIGFLAYKFGRVNFLVLSGMLAGSYTDPPALAFANSLYKKPEAASIGYATVYPLVMFLRILSPQIMVIMAVNFML